MFRPTPGGAFEGLRVIDLAQVRSGPTCVKQFADFGADVIRIEPPAHSGRTELMTGARDGADMLNLHRNKRLMTLDLKAPGAKDVMHRLVRSADIVVEYYRPDLKARLGICSCAVHSARRQAVQPPIEAEVDPLTPANLHGVPWRAIPSSH
jgi:crotonobetainyl-CoA:carnitine CoA-transferase CaiB-like acyl-CoA transferase